MDCWKRPAEGHRLIETSEGKAEQEGVSGFGYLTGKPPFSFSCAVLSHSQKPITRVRQSAVGLGISKVQRNNDPRRVGRNFVSLLLITRRQVMGSKFNVT